MVWKYLSWHHLKIPVQLRFFQRSKSQKEVIFGGFKNLFMLRWNILLVPFENDVCRYALLLTNLILTGVFLDVELIHLLITNLFPTFFSFLFFGGGVFMNFLIKFYLKLSISFLPLFLFKKYSVVPFEDHIYRYALLVTNLFSMGVHLRYLNSNIC